MLEAMRNYEGMSATICTTFDCNLRCKYCYEENKRSIKISKETVHKFIDRILEDDDPIGAKGTKDYWIPKSGLILDFIGGDSFMTVDIMDDALTYFQYKANLLHHRYATRWRASISSNGTLFGDPKVQAFIKKWCHNLSVGISIDGCPEIHDLNRVFTLKTKEGKDIGTMSTIIKWFPWLKENVPETTFTTKSTCNRQSIPYIYKSLKFMHDPSPNGLGLINIFQNFIMEDTGCTEDDYVLLDEEYRKCNKYLWKHRKEMYWSMFDKNGLNRRSDNLTEYDAGLDNGWCGSGAMPSLGMDGKIYPCFRWLPHTMQVNINDSEHMVVGNVDDGFIHKENFRQVKEATQRKISSQHCLECEFSQGCAYCIGGCFAEFKKFKRTEHICYITKLRLKWARVYWDKIFEFDNIDGKGGYLKSATSLFKYHWEQMSDEQFNKDEVAKLGHKYDDNGELKPEYKAYESENNINKLIQNCGAEPIPKGYEDVWKYRPSKVVEEGDTSYMEKSDLSINMPPSVNHNREATNCE